MEIQTFESKQEVAAALSDYLLTWSRDENFRSIALSGGSTPKIWFELLAAEYSEKLPWQNLRFFWGDERCVPPTDPESNYGMTHQYLLRQVPVPDDNIFRIRGESQPVAEAIRYSRVLEESLPSEQNVPVFDLVVLGMGDDGHTASIFPHEDFLWDANEYCVVATHPESGQQRISLTGRIINNARQVVFLVTGSKKAGRVKEIIQKLPGHEALPASHVAPRSGRLLWLLDREAAAELS